MLVQVEGIWSQNMADSTTEGGESGERRDLGFGCSYWHAHN